MSNLSRGRNSIQLAIRIVLENPSPYLSSEAMAKEELSLNGGGNSRCHPPFARFQPFPSIPIH